VCSSDLDIETEDSSLRIEISKKQEKEFDVDDCGFGTVPPKEIKIGDSVKTRDAKSFRNTFIQFGLDKGCSSNLLSKLCGTSSTMIDKYYTANTQLESMLNILLQTNRSLIKRVS
jgi:hypothetical protein